MSYENPDIIERIEKISRNWTGEEWTPDRALDEFHLYGHAKRVAILDDFDAELQNADTSNLRRYSDLTLLRRQMDNAHHALRKANR
jgi:hypothetical protein